MMLAEKTVKTDEVFSIYRPQKTNTQEKSSMSDKEFTFESEQILEAQKKKKIIIIGAIIAAAAALVALGIVLIVRSQNKTHKSEEGVQYSYTWKETSDGIIDLSIDRSTQPDCSWVLTGVNSEAVKVYAPATQPAKRSDFSLVIEEPETALVSFRLQNDTTGEGIHVLEFDLEAWTDEEGKISRDLQLHSDYVLQGLIAGGEGTEHPYTIIRDDESGGLLVSIEDNWVRTEIRETADPDEELKVLLEWIENGGDEEDEGETYRNPFTGEEISGADLRKLLMEHMDELESLIAAEAETAAETQILMHEDWTVKFSNEGMIIFNGFTSLDRNEAEEQEEGKNLVVCSLLPAGLAGTCDVMIRSDSAGAQLTVSCVVGADGSFTVSGHSLESFEPIEPEGGYEPNFDNESEDTTEE